MNTELLISELLDTCKGVLPINDINIAIEYNHNREWGLALDQIQYSIIENEISISNLIKSQIKNCIDAMDGYGITEYDKIIRVNTKIAENTTEIYSAAFDEIKSLLSGYLGSDNNLDPNIRLAAHLAYAFHGSRDIQSAINMIELVKNITSFEYSKDFLDVLKSIKSAQQVDAPEPATMVSPASQTPQRPAR